MPGVEQYIDAFKRMEPKLAASGPSWLHDARKSALESFRTRGFPKLRDEEWRFTRTRPIQERDFSFVETFSPNGLSVERVKDLTFDDKGCHRVVIVDGHFVAGLSDIDALPDGVTVSSLQTAAKSAPAMVEAHLGRYASVADNPFVALNTAFTNDGIFVHIDTGVAVAEPLHLAFVTTHPNVITQPRVLVVVGESAQATIVESYAGTTSQYFTNAVIEIACADNASLTHCKFQQEDETAFHVANQHAVLSNSSRFSTESISIGGALVRNDISSVLDGEDIDCRVDGLYLAHSRQHVDNHTYIRHARPHCHSFELYKGILDGRARGVFNGKIYVDPDAQKTDAKQQNNCILLSDDARINTNPQLEIFADDVKCTHGATVGQLDETAVFYLRSRGIKEPKARQLLIHAFAAEVIDRVSVEELRKQLEVELLWWLSKNIAD